MNFSVIKILKEHGAMTFEEIADILGSEVDPIDLQIRLDDMVMEGFIVWSELDNEVKLYNVKER